MKRQQATIIKQDLEKKIVLLVGPRQSGKTWLAKDVAAGFPSSVYLHYDQIRDREVILQQA